MPSESQHVHREFLMNLEPDPIPLVTDPVRVYYAG
jgi:hypothetical protein